MTTHDYLKALTQNGGPTVLDVNNMESIVKRIGIAGAMQALLATVERLDDDWRPSEEDDDEVAVMDATSNLYDSVEHARTEVIEEAQSLAAVIEEMG